MNFDSKSSKHKHYLLVFVVSRLLIFILRRFEQHVGQLLRVAEKTKCQQKDSQYQKKRYKTEDVKCRSDISSIIISI